MAGPLIVTAELGPTDLAWLNGLRRRHYPAERNRLPAHLTMFHALLPSAEQEVRHLLSGIASGEAPKAFISGVMNLGGGVAFRVASEDLDRIRAEIADRLTGLLTAQDRAGWSAHVTIQNKVTPRDAKALIQALGSQFDRKPIRVAGLGLHRYLGGPWETLLTYPFRG